MRMTIRCLNEYRELWRVWLPLLALTFVSTPIAVSLPLVEKQFIDGVMLAQRLDLLPTTVGLYVALWVGGTICQVISSALRTYLGERLMLRLRQRLFEHCGKLALAFSNREHSGRTMALFGNDIPTLVDLFTTTTVVALGSVIGLVVGSIAVISLSWQLAVVAGVAAPLVAALATVLTRPLRPAARRAQEKTAELVEHIQENLAGIREVVAFGRERSQGQRFGATLAELLRLRMRLTFLETGIQGGQMLFGLTMTLAIYGYGGYLVVQGQASLGTLVAMQGLLGLLLYPARSIVGVVAGTQKALASAERIYAFLDRVPGVQERPTTYVLREEEISGTVTFERVGFGYEANQPVLHDVSLTARPGETIALVGPSGAGKTTLVSLIARFFDPTEGRVLLDGKDLRDLPLAGLRGQIGIVFQDTFLFADTIRENIAFGREGALEADIIGAARSANAWEFIEQLPQGLDTQVGERGVRLSEGQKQRLSIARALLRNPRILILDEPTSALDARSEHLLQTALDNLMRGRTTFVIAHRLATVQRANQILVLEHGWVVEQGTHSELLQREGLYHELFQLQFGAVAERLNASAVRTLPALVAQGS